jgi:hypothetical protein
MEEMFMYYRTYYRKTLLTPDNTPVTIDALYAGLLNDITPINPHINKFTVRKTNTPDLWSEIEHHHLVDSILAGTIPDITYTEYHIPKSTGGFRLISAPNDELKLTQRMLADALHFVQAYPHDAAYAYVTDRTCKTALQIHQEAKTKWFYKFDIKDFFPSCTAEVLTTVLSNVFPFCSMSETQFNQLLHIALYNNSLPQGSPLSPLLSNMIMVPFDFAMYYSIKHFGGVYTRYADDILISLPQRKDLHYVQKIVARHLKERVHPSFKLNTEKSRCGSINGSNWNLGLMLNKDHNITLGHKNKMKLKAKINNFIFDFTNQNYWSIIDTQVLQGELNYFMQIEPEYARFVIQRLENKYSGITLSDCFRAIISGSVR